jgi:hypothetical protein
MKAATGNRILQASLKLRIFSAFLPIIFFAEMIFSQQALMNAQSILQLIPYPNSAQTLAAFNGLIVTKIYPQLVRQLLLGQARPQAGFF